MELSELLRFNFNLLHFTPPHVKATSFYSTPHLSKQKDLDRLF